MKLHKNKELFKQSVRFTAQQMNIPDIYIEKDYWVTYALHAIFTHSIGKDTIFKGGTSLSKCFGLIDRFSEDIDLVVLRNISESNNQLNNKIIKIGAVVAETLPEVQIDEVTHKKGMIRKTAHTYAKEFKSNYGQVRDIIIIEASWLGHCEPYITKTAQTFIYEMMRKEGHSQLTQEYNLLPFKLLVLEPQRTICEKIMSLIRFSYTDTPIENLKNKVRHCYDLHQLLQNQKLLEFFYSLDFDKMLLKVVHSDIISFKNNNAWLKYHPINAIIFAEIETVWNDLKATYNGVFKSLVFGTFPHDEKIFKTLINIKNRLYQIKWDINLDGLI